MPYSPRKLGLATLESETYSSITAKSTYSRYLGDRAGVPWETEDWRILHCRYCRTLLAGIYLPNQVEEEQAQQRELALEKEKMASAFSNLKKLVEEDADTEAEYVKVSMIQVHQFSVICLPTTYRTFHVKRAQYTN